MADTPQSQVNESGEYENLMELAGQNKQEAEENPDAFKSLFDVEEVEINPDHWTQHWKGMPEYTQENNGPWKTIRMHFRNEEDYIEFSNLTKNRLTDKTKSAWYPKLEITKNALLRWIEDDDEDDDDPVLHGNELYYPEDD
jgi:hypothetical protein